MSRRFEPDLAKEDQKFADLRRLTKTNVYARYTDIY